MLQTMNDYFSAEKSESVFFIVAGLIAISLALWLWADGHRLKSAAYPLVAIALIQLVVGCTVFFRTDAQVAKLQQEYAAAPGKFKTEETTRMNVVMKSFSLYKMLEIALLAIGIGLILAMRQHDLALGIGGGLVIQSALMLFLDLFAETRGEDYLAALSKLAG